MRALLILALLVPSSDPQGWSTLKRGDEEIDRKSVV